MSRRRAAAIAAVVVASCGGSPRPTAPPGDPGSPPVPSPKPEAPMLDTPPIQTATPQELTFPDEDFRKAQPAAGAPRPFRLPQIKPITLNSGIKVYLVEQHALPIVSMDLNFDGGSMTDPKGKEGLASLCMAMLTEGTARLDKLQYAEALADVASNISTYAADDSTGISLSSLTKHLATTFALFADTLRSPGFRTSDFERMVQRRIESVKQSKGSVGSIAGRVTGPLLYGPAHPFGTVVTEESLARITIDDCKAYAASYLRPAAARLFVVGDLTEAQVRAYFDRGELAAWRPAGARPAPLLLPAPRPLAGRIFFVDVPGAAQSQVTMLHFGPRRTAADYFANTMLSAVFGGGFTSRINMNLREAKGYAYGARGGFGYPSRQYGTFTVSSSVQADATYQSILEIDRQVKELWSGKDPIRNDELEREQQGAILGLPGQFATAQAALGQYRRLVYFGLPLDYYTRYVANIAQVTVAQVKAAAAKQLRPGQAVYLVVGDGNTKMIVGVANQDTDPRTGARKTVWARRPYVKDGQQLTLREALADLARRGDVGAGGLVELDRDGKPRP